MFIVKKGRYNGTADPLHNILLLENAQQHTKSRLVKSESTEEGLTHTWLALVFSWNLLTLR